MANQVLYGFHQIKDLGLRVSGNVDMVNNAINASVEEHNRELDALNGMFVFRTTAYTESYAQGGVARLQPLDQNGRALPIKSFGSYNIAYPIQMAGQAWGANYVTREKMTAADAMRNTAMMLDSDSRWMRDHILAALFSNVDWLFTDSMKSTADLIIKPLANGATTQYQIQAGQDGGLTDTHQYAQAAAISDAANPFPTLYQELMEHPENSGDVVVLIPTGLKASVQALASFHPIADPNVQLGSGQDVLTGSIGVASPGKLIGYEDSGCWIVEWKGLPANYGIAVTTAGEKVLAQREDEEASLQGFKKVAERNDHPFYESQWLRRAGFGARNRVGAVAFRIGNATYAVPTGYQSPMY